MLPKTIMPSLPPGSPHERVLEYHKRSRHFPDQYAARPATVDWTSPPAAFRRYQGSTFVPLTLLRERPAADPRRALFMEPLTFPLHRWEVTCPLDVETLGLLLESSLGVTAFKSDGPDRWALRANPSSGNLHPVEAYVVAVGVGALEDGL